MSIQILNTITYLSYPSLDECVAQYNDGLRSVLDRHAPLRTRTFVLRPKAPWWSHNLRELKSKCRWAERCWRAAVRKHDPQAQRMNKVYKSLASNYYSALHTARTDSIKAQVEDCKADQRALFRLVGDLTGSVAPQLIPERPSLQVVVDELSNFFSSRISSMRSDLDLRNQPTPIR